MKAAFLESPGQFAIRDIDSPEPGPGEILVRAGACGICSSELDMFEGRANIDYPRFAGHEVAGTVERVGKGVTDFAVGDRVALYAEGRGFAEYSVAPARYAVKLREDTAFDLALGEPIACAVNGVRKIQPQLNDTVAIVGCGFMGLMLVQLFRLAGASMVIAIDTRESILAIAREVGATHTFNPREADVAVEIHRLTGGRGVDVGVEGAGIQATLDLTSQITRMEGKLQIFGYHLGGKREIDVAYWNWMAFHLVNGHTRSPHIYVEGMRIGLALMEAGSLRMEPLVTHRYALGSINDGFAEAVRKQEGFIKGVVLLEGQNS
jgi:threonine dehydrogenase-like Zn-dependent dehydrogenase